MTDPRPVSPEAAPPRATTPEPMAESAFRKQLSVLIEGYDAAHSAKAAHDDDGEQCQWERAFEELLIETTADQARRALKRLELHVQNRSQETNQ